MIIPEEDLKALVLKLGLIDEKGMTELMDFNQKTGASLEQSLVERNIVTDENLGKIISTHLNIPFVTLSRVAIPDDVLHIVPEKIAKQYKVVAFERTPEGIKLAMADPTNITIQEMIAKKTGQKITVHLASAQDIASTFHVFRKNLQKAFDELVKQANSAANPMTLTEAPVMKIVDMLVEYAYQEHASDIHIEPEEDRSLVRFRIDGILHDFLFFSKHLHDRVVTRIKVLSRLRTDEHLSPQDGKMRFDVDDGTLDLRVSIIPVVGGEKIVLRLLASHTKQLTLVDLGMNEKDLAKVTSAYNKSYGMILSTGPTGSGKSTSIYAILKILNIRESNITTIEDPVEYRLKGVNQIQVNAKTNLTFAAGLRSILRQDPNIVFVGEIRDTETAGIAVNAALTGHLVLSTLHTNDAATALPRLTDMKIEPFLVASTVNVIIAQRLVRKICELCKVSVDTTIADLIKELPADKVKKHFTEKKQIRVYKGTGCKVCHNTGYQGRIGVFEVLEVTAAIKELITSKADSDIILKKAIEEGMTVMLDDGVQKVVKGLTTVEEILRVTKVESL